MARSRKQKEELVQEYAKRIKESKAVYIVEPKGLTANQSTEIKKGLFDLDSSFNVVKNTIFKLALEECGMTVPDGITVNQKAIVFSSDQISESAKVISTFIGENKESMEVVGGYLNGEEISAGQIKDLADLPTRDVMLAQVIGTMNAPINGFVNVLAGNVKNIINVVNAIKDQKSE